MDNEQTKSIIIPSDESQTGNKKSERHKNQFILELTSADVELLINDLELEEKGYLINFIIDPYDIFRFCFPYGLRFQDVRTIDGVGDEMIAYEHIFENYNPIILDDYKFELSINRTYFHNNLSEFNDKGNNLKLFLQKYDESDLIKRKRLLKELEESFSFLLSSSILAESYVKHFDEIYNNLQIKTIKLKKRKKKVENYYLQVFQNNQRTDWATTAFKQWIKEKDATRYFSKMPNSAKNRTVQNAFRDLGVIDRVCNINKQLQENQNDRNHLILYFSSPKRSQEFFSNKIIKKHLPTIEGKRHYNLLRNSRHAYIMFLLGGQPPKDILSALRKLKEITDRWESEEKEKEKIRTNLKDKKNEDVDQWMELYNLKDARRETLEKESIARRVHNHTKFQEALKETIIKLKEDDFDEVAKHFEKVLKKAEDVYETIRTLYPIKLSYSIESNLTELVKKVFLENTKENQLNIQTGLDAIIGGYHHLPILLFLNNKDLIPVGLSDLLNEVVDFVVKSPKNRKESNESFFHAISTLYEESERAISYNQKSYFGAIVKVFIYLISPHKEGRKEKEKEAHEFLSRIVQLMAIGKIADNDRLTDLYGVFKNMDSFYQKLKPDYLYFLIWTFRRNKKIKESLNFSEQAIKDYPNDPRFYHGKCLALYNKYINIKNLEVGKLKDLEDLVKNAEIAIFHYSEIKKDSSKRNNKYFINCSVVALQNALLYSVSVYYLSILENQSIESFEKSRFRNYPIATRAGKNIRQKLLAPIINFEEREHNQNIKDFPEIAHTEAVLELCEAIYYFKEGTEAGNTYAKNKLNHAEHAISMSLKYDPEFDLYLITEQKINEWKNKIID